MPERRSEIILAGAVIWRKAMTLLGIESLTVSDRPEGVIADWMLTHGLSEDRLRYQSSVRERRCSKTAQKYQVKPEHTERIAAFALSF